MNAPLQVELKHGSRVYGSPEHNPITQARQTEPPEPIGKIFVDDLRGVSAILALSATATFREIFAAYQADIKLLAIRRTEADGFMAEVLKTALSGANVDPTRQRQEVKILTDQLAPLGIEPQIPLTADKCALPAAELVVWIKQEFNNELDRMARRVAATLHLLVECRVVGLIDWASTDVCTLHYLSWDFDRSTTKNVTSQYDERTRYILETTTRTETASLIRHHHVHHLVDAGIHTVKDYKHPIPSRIKALLESAPAWLKPHITIIDGQETFCQEIVDVAGVTQHIDKSVVRYDPAAAIGDIALIGWTGEEVRTQQVESRQEYELLIRLLLIAALVIISLSSVMAFFAMKGEVADMNSHREYLGKFDGKPAYYTFGKQAVFTVPTPPPTPADESLEKEFGLTYQRQLTLPVRIEGIRSQMPGKPTLALSIPVGTMGHGPSTTTRFFEMEDIGSAGDGQAYYGTANLSDAFGLPYVVHILSSDGHYYKYVIERR